MKLTAEKYHKWNNQQKLEAECHLHKHDELLKNE